MCVCVWVGVVVIIMVLRCCGAGVGIGVMALGMPSLAMQPRLQVRIKGEVMTLPSVAVGGTIPILCGEPDLIRPLLKRGYIFSSDEL